MRPSGSPEVLERRRFKAIELLEAGFQPVENVWGYMTRNPMAKDAS